MNAIVSSILILASFVALLALHIVLSYSLWHRFTFWISLLKLLILSFVVAFVWQLVAGLLYLPYLMAVAIPTLIKETLGDRVLYLTFFLPSFFSIPVSLILVALGGLGIVARRYSIYTTCWFILVLATGYAAFLFGGGAGLSKSSLMDQWRIIAVGLSVGGLSAGIIPLIFLRSRRKAAMPGKWRWLLKVVPGCAIGSLSAGVGLWLGAIYDQVWSAAWEAGSRFGGTWQAFPGDRTAMLVITPVGILAGILLGLILSLGTIRMLTRLTTYLKGLRLNQR